MNTKSEIDITPNENGAYSIVTTNRRKLLFDGLLDTFSKFGKIVTVCPKGIRGTYISFTEKNSALACYHELHANPDFMVELPDKVIKKNTRDLYLENALDEECEIKYKQDSVSDNCTLQNEQHPVVHYVFKKRKILESKAFNRFIISLSAIHQHIYSPKRPNKIMSELEYQMTGINLNFEIGFNDEIEEYNYGPEEIPQLVPGQDLFYFRSVKNVNAIDVLICNLPPWYEQVDAYKLVLRLIPDDVLRIDWYRMYPCGTDEFTYPYGIIYVKNYNAACALRHAADEVVIGGRKISVCLMKNAEDLLIDVRKKLLKINNLSTSNASY